MIRTTTILAFTFFLSITINSCKSDPKSHEAEVSQAKEVIEVNAETLYKFNDGSLVTWIGTKPTGNHHGTIAISSGNISTKDGQIIGGNILMDMNAIDAVDLKDDPENFGKLVGHLKSPDFFNVENHPTSKLAITSVQKYEVLASANTEGTEDNNEYRILAPTHTIVANLTLRDTTLSITFPAKIEISDDTITAMAKFNIDRTKWGVSYGDESAAVDKLKDKFIHNKVNVGFDIVATK